MGFKVIKLMVLAIFSCSIIYSQTAYQDAVKLRKLLLPSSTILLPQSKDEVFEILNNYVPQNSKGKKDEIMKLFNMSIDGTPDPNPFIEIGGSALAHQNNNFTSIAKNAITSFGSQDVTTIADGLGKFLAKRTKEELNVAFFERFNEYLLSHPEIKQLFPTTSVFLNDIYRYQASNMLSMLRAAFESDLKAILGNIAAIADIDENAQCKCNKEGQNVKCRERIKVIKSFFNTEYGRTVMAALVIADGAVSKKNPADILSNLAGNRTLSSMSSGNKIDNDIINSLKLLNIFSVSLRSSKAGEVWVTPDFTDDAVLKIYAGLVYQKILNEKITKIEGVDIPSEYAKLATTDLKALRTYVDELSYGFNDLSADYFTLKKDKIKDTTKELILEHAQVFLADFRTVLESGFQYNTINPNLPSPGPKVQFVFNCVDTTLSIAEMVLSKNYYGAVLSTVTLIDQIMQNQNSLESTGKFADSASTAFLKSLRKNDYGRTLVVRLRSKSWKSERKINKIATSDFSYADGVLTIGGETHAVPSDLKSVLESVKDNKEGIKSSLIQYLGSTDEISLTKKNYVASLMKYGNFMADIVNSENSDDAEKAIEAVALPAGSSSIKKTTNFNIALQAYTGFAGTKDPVHTDVFNGMSVSAPIGISFNFGLKNWHNAFDKATWGSASIFLSLVDVGAIVAYRFNNQNTQLSDSVKIRLENIFAPGVNIVYGIPKVPLSIGGGLQYQASLKTLNTSNLVVTDKAGWRWQVFVAVDLPLLNLHSSKR